MSTNRGCIHDILQQASRGGGHRGLPRRAFSVHATNGYQLIGVGSYQKSMGGAVTSNPDTAMTAITNPAGMAWVDTCLKVEGMDLNLLRWLMPTAEGLSEQRLDALMRRVTEFRAVLNRQYAQLKQNIQRHCQGNLRDDIRGSGYRCHYDDSEYDVIREQLKRCNMAPYKEY